MTDRSGSFSSSSLNSDTTTGRFLVITASALGRGLNLSITKLSITYSAIPGALASPGDSIDATFIKSGLSASNGPIIKSFDVEFGLKPAKVRIDLWSGTSFIILEMFSRMYAAPPTLVAVVAGSSSCSLLGPMRVLITLKFQNL